MNTAAGTCELSWSAQNNPRILSDQKLNLRQQILNILHKKVYVTCELFPLKALIRPPLILCDVLALSFQIGQLKAKEKHTESMTGEKTG